MKERFSAEQNLFPFYEHFKVYESCDQCKAPLLSKHNLAEKKPHPLNNFVCNFFPSSVEFIFVFEIKLCKSSTVKQKGGRTTKAFPSRFVMVIIW